MQCICQLLASWADFERGIMEPLTDPKSHPANGWDPVLCDQAWRNRKSPSSIPPCSPRTALKLWCAFVSWIKCTVNFGEWHPSLLDAASRLQPQHPRLGSSEHILMLVMKIYGLLNLECMVYWTLSQFFIVHVLRSFNSFSLSFSDRLACPWDWNSVLKRNNVKFLCLKVLKP